jgi:hypothetical protein
MSELLDDHVTVRPVRTFPFASRVVAVSEADDPTVMFCTVEVTVTDATDAATGV